MFVCRIKQLKVGGNQDIRKVQEIQRRIISLESQIYHTTTSQVSRPLPPHTTFNAPTLPLHLLFTCSSSLHTPLVPLFQLYTHHSFPCSSSLHTTRSLVPALHITRSLVPALCTSIVPLFQLYTHHSFP